MLIPAVSFGPKRIGENKKIFWLHKFRSMKMNTPDIPTHLLDNPGTVHNQSGSCSSSVQCRRVAADFMTYSLGECRLSVRVRHFGTRTI